MRRPPAAAAPAPPIDRGLRIAEVALALGVDRSTVYKIPFLRARMFRPTAGGRGQRIKQSDVALYVEQCMAGDTEARRIA